MDVGRIIDEAKRERERLLESLARLDDFIRSAEGLLPSASTTEKDGCPEPEPTATSPRPSSVMARTIEAADAELERAGGPLQTRELVELLEVRGVEIGGKDKVATLSARMNNAKKYRNQRGVGWWFKSRSFPDERSGSGSEAAAGDRGADATAASEGDQEGGKRDAPPVAD